MKKVTFISAIFFLVWTTCWSQPETSRAYTMGDTLITTKWSQHGVYKSKTPVSIFDASIHARLGCWTTAIAQIINYHQLQSAGKASDYDCTSDTIKPKHIKTNDLDAFTYDWAMCKDKVTSTSPALEQKNVATLCYDVATVIQKDFGTGKYALDEQDMIAALGKHFPGITSETRWDYDLTPAEIKKEIDRFQPIMFYILGRGHNLKDSGSIKTSRAKSGDNQKTANAVVPHAVVIDGYRYKNRVFQVHLNYGWGGKNNGWYNYHGVFPGLSGTTSDDYDNTSHREGMIIVTHRRSKSL